MSRFYVGQRVRILVGNHKGSAATILSPPQLCRETGTSNVYMGHDVDIDGLGPCDPNDGIGYAFEPHELEPLDDYDGNTVTTWANSVWKPRQVRA